MKTQISLALFTLVSVAYADPFQCPDGTQFKTKTLKEHGIMVDWCENRNGHREGPFRYVRESDGSIEADYSYRSGKKHGVAHIYHDDGTLEMEVLYENGEEISSEFSMGGLRRITKQWNTVAHETGRRSQIVLVNERALQYNTTLEFPWSWFAPDQNDIADKLTSNAEVCSLFQLPGTSFESVNVRYIKKSGELLVETTIKKSECKFKRKG